MDFFDTVANRHSIRAFKDREIEQEKVGRILEAMNRAPSAGDLQAYQVYVVRSRKRRLALARAALEQFFISDAPVVLVFCALPMRSGDKYGMRGEELYAVQDATIACAYAQLAASALGLGSTWVGAFDEGAVRRAVGAGMDEVPVAILPVGYPDEVPEPATRRAVAEMVREV
ncbi:MAG: nitroreductase family protein [Chloroflexi bacterium]|nr:nitroreductase family protein [Chloroflexota bacterium]